MWAHSSKGTQVHWVKNLDPAPFSCPGHWMASGSCNPWAVMGFPPKHHSVLCIWKEDTWKTLERHYNFLLHNLMPNRQNMGRKNALRKEITVSGAKAGTAPAERIPQAHTVTFLAAANRPRLCQSAAERQQKVCHRSHRKHDRHGQSSKECRKCLGCSARNRSK